VAKVTWGGGVTGRALDEADRSQFTPYDGPVPPNKLFCFRVKMLKKGKSSNDNPQLIIGLELVPRRTRPEEKQYKGYYITDYIVVLESTTFRVAPFLDAIGVSGREFAEHTSVGPKDDRGSKPITKIGHWVNDGKQFVLATLKDGMDQKGNPRKEIAGYRPVEELTSKSDEEEDDSIGEEEEEEEAPARKPAKKAAPKKRQPEPEPEPEEEEEEEESPPPRKKAAAKKAAPKRRRDEDEDEEGADAESDEEDEAPF